MKPRYTIALFLLLALALASCGSPKTEPGADASPLDDTYTDALSIRSQLVLGTLKAKFANRRGWRFAILPSSLEKVSAEASATLSSSICRQRLWFLLLGNVRMICSHFLLLTSCRRSRGIGETTAPPLP